MRWVPVLTGPRHRWCCVVWAQGTAASMSGRLLGSGNPPRLAAAGGPEDHPAAEE